MLDFLKSMFVKNYENLNGQSFKSLFESTPGAVIIDVRTPAEFKSGSIKGAKNIDLMSSSFEQKIDSLEKGKTYFMVCRSGNRSGQACNIMSEKGFKVYNLAGGVGAWPQ
jgi:rhodanese-related sulfurtransferase